MKNAALCGEIASGNSIAMSSPSNVIRHFSQCFLAVEMIYVYCTGGAGGLKRRVLAVIRIKITFIAEDINIDAFAMHHVMHTECRPAHSYVT